MIRSPAPRTCAQRTRWRIRKGGSSWIDRRRIAEGRKRPVRSGTLRQKGDVHRAILLERLLDFGWILVGIGQDRLHSRQGPLKVGSRLSRIEFVFLSNHQHLPNCEGRANDVGLASAERVPEFYLREPFVEQRFLREERQSFLGGSVQTRREAIQGFRLIVRQFQSDASNHGCFEFIAFATGGTASQKDGVTARMT